MSKARLHRLFQFPVAGWALVITLLIAWQVWASIWPSPTLPTLTSIGAEWRERAFAGELAIAVADTLSNMAWGFAASTLLGITLGFLMGRVRVAWAFLEPLIELIRQVPVTALLPLFILYLGLGNQMKIAVIIISGLFPILLSAYAGARSVPKTMRETADTFQLNWWQTQVEVALPAAIPFILVGMRQAMALSLIMSVVTGMLAGNSGLGYFVLEAQQTLDITALFAGIFTIALIGYALNGIFVLIEARCFKWRKLDEHRS